jgi:hypothetical protein
VRLPGYGWLTILNAAQVRRLGGVDRVRERAPAEVIPIESPRICVDGDVCGPSCAHLRRYVKLLIPSGNQEGLIEEVRGYPELLGSL